LVGWIVAAAKRYTAEQIVAKLREPEKLQGQGMTIPQVCKRLRISEQTFYRWRTKYGALKEDEAHRLKALEQENARLKRIIAEQALDVSMLRDLRVPTTTATGPVASARTSCRRGLKTRPRSHKSWTR
jgi:putative transposase